MFAHANTKPGDICWRNGCVEALLSCKWEMGRKSFVALQIHCEQANGMYELAIIGRNLKLRTFENKEFSKVNGPNPKPQSEAKPTPQGFLLVLSKLGFPLAHVGQVFRLALVKQDFLLAVQNKVSHLFFQIEASWIFKNVASYWLV